MGNAVDLTGTEGILWVKYLRGDVPLHDGLDKSHILIICHPAPVVDLSSKIVQHLIGHILVFIQQHFQLPLADPQILIGKLIGNVPPNGAEFSPVLDDGMEEAEAEKQTLVLLRFKAFRKLGLRDTGIGAKEVCPQSLWGLDGHFD